MSSSFKSLTILFISSNASVVLVVILPINGHLSSNTIASLLSITYFSVGAKCKNTKHNKNDTNIPSINPSNAPSILDGIAKITVNFNNFSINPDNVSKIFNKQ